MSVAYNINEIGSRFSLDNIDLDPPKVIIRETGELEDWVMDGQWSLFTDNNNEVADFTGECVYNSRTFFVFNLPMTLSSLSNYGRYPCGNGGGGPK